MNERWLMKMSLWARNPPSWRRIKFIAAVIGLCFVMFGYEYVFGWPEWLTVNKGLR